MDRKFPNIKICFFDIDGVLKGDKEKLINPLLLKAIRGLKKKGILCTVASGRDFVSARRSMNGFVPNAPMVVDNGARISGPLKDKDLFCVPLSPEEIKKIAEYFNRPEIKFVSFFPLNKKGLKKAYTIHNSVEADIKVTKSHIIDRTYRDKQEYLDCIRDNGCARINFRCSEKMRISKKINSHFSTLADCFSYDINQPGVDKAVGVARLLKILGIKKSEAMFIGNDENDLPMFKSNLGLKVAFGHAPTKVKKMAHMFIPDHEELIGLLKKLNK